MKIQKFILQLITACAPMSGLSPSPGHRLWPTPLYTNGSTHEKQGTSRNYLQGLHLDKGEMKRVYATYKNSVGTTLSPPICLLPKNAMSQGESGSPD